MLVDLSLARHAPIHEHIAFSAVSVHVAVEHDLVFFVVVLNQFLGVVDGWVQNFRRIWPSAIEISSSGIAAVVTSNDPVWVEHGHYLEYECVSQQLCLLIILLQ